jgi:hypothetical protein
MLPVQIPGLPGGPELLIVLLLALIIVVFVGRWVYRDAKARGSKWAWQWSVGISVLFFFGLVPGLLGLVIYLFLRDDKLQGQQPQ